MFQIKKKNFEKSHLSALIMFESQKGMQIEIEGNRDLPPSGLLPTKSTTARTT